MDETLREKLAGEIDTATWRDLAPHHQRGALLLCGDQVDLLEVAVALAEDDVTRVDAWLSSGVLRRPAPDEAEALAALRVFKVAIVQPFVVVQPIG